MPLQTFCCGAEPARQAQVASPVQDRAADRTRAVLLSPGIDRFLKSESYPVPANPLCPPTHLRVRARTRDTCARSLQPEAAAGREFRGRKLRAFRPLHAMLRVPAHRVPPPG